MLVGRWCSNANDAQPRRLMNEGLFTNVDGLCISLPGSGLVLAEELLLPCLYKFDVGNSVRSGCAKWRRQNNEC